MTKPNRMNCHRKFCLQATIAALLSTGLSLGAQAQELSLSTSVNISQTSGGFATSAGITASTGTVGDVSNIPTVTNGVPNFTFTFAQSGVTGAYTFTPGLVIQQVGSQRRLEVQLPTLTLTFDGSGNIIPASSSVAAGVSNIRGKSADGGTTISGTLTDDGSSIAITNTSIGFNAGSIMSRIVAQNPGGILNDIVNSFSSSAGYTYTIVMKPGNAALKLGTGGTGASLTQFPKLTIAACDSGFSLAGGAQTAEATIFTIAPSLAAGFANGYALTGRIGVGQAASGTLGNIGISCTPTPAPASTPTPDSSASTSIDNTGSSITGTTLSSTPTATELQNVNVLSDTTNQLSTDVTAGLTAGTVTVETALKLLDTLNDMTTLSKTVATSTTDTATSSQLLQNNLDNAAKVISALASKPGLTDAQKTQMQTVAQSIMEKSSTSLSTSLSSTQVSNIKEKAASLLQSASTANGGAAKKEVSDAALSISSFSLQKALTTPGFSVPSFRRPSYSISYTPRVCRTYTYTHGGFLGLGVPGITHTETICTGGRPFLTSGLKTESGTVVDAITLPTLFPNPTTIKIETATGIVSAADVMRTVLGAGSTVTYDAATSMVRIQSGGLDLPVYISEVTLAPSAFFTNGLTLMSDGSALMVGSNLAVRVIPASRDAQGLADAIAAANVTVATEFDGNLFLTAGSERLSGTFAFEHVPRTNTQSGPVTFSLPAGNPALASFVIRANYVDGSSQKILPYIDEQLFYFSTQILGANFTTDRTTGILTLTPGGQKLRPDYFVKNLTASDTAFHTANKDGFGIAYRQTTDFNADGKLDVEVITATGKQILYVLP